MKLCYLLDENLSLHLTATIRRYYPLIEVLRVGDVGAPPAGTLDPEILDYLERAQRTLVTDNRRSMPGHLADHLTTGRHHWGVFLFTRGHRSGVSPTRCTCTGM